MTLRCKGGAWKHAGRGLVRGKGGRGEGIQKGRRASREERPMILNS
jgi:hypothetical protein